MSRHKWLYAKWPQSMRILATGLKARPFLDQSPDGFIVDRVRNDYIEARYIERIEYTDTAVDPFGNAIAYERLVYKQCAFRASSSWPGLELENTQRSVQGLLNRLLEVNKHTLTVSPLAVNVLLWATTFQEITNSSLVMDSIQIGSMELAPGVSARAIVKGDSDVRDISSAFTQGRRHNLEKVQLRFKGTQKGTIVLTNQGVAKIDFEQPSQVIGELRESLVRVTNSIAS